MYDPLPDSRRLIYAAMAVGGLLFVSAGSEASILLPLSSVDVKQILTEVGSNQTSSSSTSRSNRAPAPLEDYEEENSIDDNLTQRFAPNASGESSSSGTSSGGGPSGANSVAVAAGVPRIAAGDVIAWALSEWRVAVPTPPGNVLLRPPQERSHIL